MGDPSTDTGTDTEGGAGASVMDTDFRIGLSARASLTLHRCGLASRLVVLVLGLGLLAFSWTNSSTQAPVWHYTATRFFLPLVIVVVLQLICSLHSVLAWTRTSLRQVYVDVFYVSVVSRLCSIFLCVYMLAMLAIPHHFLIHNSTTIQVLTFPTSYLVVCGVVFSYVLLDDVIVISFIAGLYFKMDKFVKVLTKYSWVRRLCHVCIDLLLAGYYTYTILSRGYAGYRLTLLALCLGAGAANAYIMYKQVCQPGTFKIRNLDEMEPPEDVKIQTAFKIVKMKADVKEAANTSASSA